MESYSDRPLLWVCAPFILGIIINKYLNIPFVVFSLLAVSFLFLSLFIRHSKIATVLLLLAVLCGGAVYSQNYEAVSRDHLTRLSCGDHTGPILMEGLVVSDVEPRSFLKSKKTVFFLDVKRFKSKWGWENRRGVVLVNLFREEDIRYGDYMIIEGNLHRPFNYSQDSSFSYREYLYRKGITFILSVKKAGRAQVLKRDQGGLIKAASLRLKRRLSGILKNNLPKEEAGLMQAFLLGDRYDIPKSVYDLFKISGVAHIIAISGFNIGIVAYVIGIILKMFPIPRAAQYILTMGLLILYAFMTGGQPPVVRATIMAVIFLTSFLVEREYESINTLATAALILLFMNPLNLFDAGFQLSFVSVLFIILLYTPIMGLFYKLLPGLNEKVKGDHKPGEKSGLAYIQLKGIRYLLQSAAISIAAYLGAVGMIAYYFKLITPVVIIANLIVVPLASLLIFLGMGLLAAGMVFPFIAFVFANCIIVFLNLMIVVVFMSAQIPGAYFRLKSVPLWGVFLYYGVITIGAGFYSLRSKKSIAQPNTLPK